MLVTYLTLLETAGALHSHYLAVTNK